MGLVGHAYSFYFATSPASMRDDLFQNGMLGLLRAAELFDESREIAFSTYATGWIRRYMIDAIRGSSIIRIPSYVSGDRRRDAVDRLTTTRIDEELNPIHAPEDDCKIDDDEELENRHAKVERLLSFLPERHRDAVRLRFFDGLKLRAIGKELGVSPERARQLIRNSISHLRELGFTLKMWPQDDAGCPPATRLEHDMPVGLNPD